MCCSAELGKANSPDAPHNNHPSQTVSASLDLSPIAFQRSSAHSGSQSPTSVAFMHSGFLQNLRNQSNPGSPQSLVGPPSTRTRNPDHQIYLTSSLLQQELQELHCGHISHPKRAQLVLGRIFCPLPPAETNPGDCGRFSLV